jgi:CheY-like chemotaxis protein
VGSKRVLIVDDDPDIREIVMLTLSDEGYEVVTAPHGAAALDRAAELPPDAILLDMRMPVMDGWAFAAAYRRTPDPHAPVVVMTAAADAAAWAAQVGAAAVLPKPFQLDALCAAVERITRP